MGNFFSELGAQIRRLWQGLVLWQRAVLIAVIVLVPLGLVWLVITLQPNYELLYANLSEGDRVLIEQRLTEAQIPFRSDTAANSVSVDTSKKDRARMLLAEEGLPHARTQGYALFDKQRLGATEFEQRLNFQRALEQELQNAIQSLTNVRRARVLLVLPTPTVFTEKEKPPKASVLLALRDQQLDPAQINGVVHLVSNAVEGLTPENVVVSDSTGRVLSKRYDSASALTEEQRALRELAERSREEKILSALTAAYGNKVDGSRITAVASARVTAEFDHDSIETEKTSYDPESIVSKEQIVSESSEGVPVPAVGVPGVTSNILGVGSAQGAGTYTREESTTEYQAGMTREVRRQAPRLTSLSTAVIVNSQVLSATPGTPEYTTEQQKIRNIVNAIVGYNPTATDSVIQQPQVEFVSFAPYTAPPPTVVPVPWYRNPLMVLSVILGLLSVALLALLLKPRAGREEAGVEALPSADVQELQALLEQQRSALDDEERERRRRRRQALIDLADANPDEIERVMRHWGELSE